MSGNILDNEQSVIYGIYEFEDKIKSGVVSDRKGKAELIIDGATYSTYTVHIDRRIVSSSGKVVSFYKHQGRKPTTLEWWDECHLID